MKRNPPNRNPASRYLVAADILSAALERSEAPLTVASELADIPYIVLDKYLRKERNIKDEATAKRMVAVADVLNDMVDAGLLPVPADVNKRLRRPLIIGMVNEFIS